MRAELREISIPVSTDRTLQAAEAYAYHSQWVSKNPSAYQPETLRRINTGADIGATRYIHADRQLKRDRREITALFSDVDLFITPTTPIPAPTIAELKDHPENLRARELVLLRNTRPINVWGLPAISIPCGFSAAGLPIGLQIVGRPNDEITIIALAAQFEEARPWRDQRPQVA